MEFVNWTTLTTCAGALAMVAVVTQMTKNIKIIKKMPTQLWSYIVAVAILYAAHFFTGRLTLSDAVLILFNGMIVALSANGGFAAIQRAFPNLFKI